MTTSDSGLRKMLPRLVAEGFVIIVGVLVALAVDRAATRVDERSIERQYLSGLATDLRSIADALQQASSAAKRRDEAARIVLAAARGDSDAASSGTDLARDLVLAGFIIEQPFVRDTWDDVVNTGRLYVLRDAELRRRIGSFYRQAEQLQAFNRDWVETAGHYQVAVRRVLDPEISEAVYLELIYGRRTQPSYSPPFSLILERIWAEPQLLPTLSSVLVINTVSAQSYDSLSGQALSLATDIEGRQPAS